MDGVRLDEFVVKVGVHQGSVLSCLLFAVVMDEITRDVKEGGVNKISMLMIWFFLEMTGQKWKIDALDGKEQ